MEHVGVKLFYSQWSLHCGHKRPYPTANVTRSGFIRGSTPQPRVDRAEGVNGIITQIRSRNHIYNAFVEELIFTRALVQSLSMGMGRCQALNPIQPISQPSLIVFQILVPSKGFLIGYSKLSLTHTHIIMHLAYDMTYHPRYIMALELIIHKKKSCFIFKGSKQYIQ